MKLHILVVSKTRWSTRKKKHREIQKIMTQPPIEEVTITTIHQDLGRPEIVDGRITAEWFENNISILAKARGYNAAVFQFSKRDGQRWGIKSGLRGSNLRDGDFFGESWVCCDEDTVRRFKDGSKRNEYVKTVPHEIAHELQRQGVTQLNVHEYDYTDTINNIEGFYIDMYKKHTPVSKLKDTLDALMRKMFTLQPQRVLPSVDRKVQELLQVMQQMGLPMKVVEGYRSIERQDALYAQGRTAPGSIVTNAKGGQSFHNYGVAVDCVFTVKGWNAPDSDWKKYGKAAEALGFEWGGSWENFVDRPHIQFTQGYTLTDFQNKKVDYSKFL